MKRRIILAVFLCMALGRTGRAEAGWLHTLVCDDQRIESIVLGLLWNS